MDEQQDEQAQLPDAAPVELRDDQGDTQLGDADGDDELRDELAAQLRDRELEEGAPVSDNVVGCWAVYDNHELRFVAGGGIHDDREDAQRELDELRPSTGHDLVIVEV